MGLLNEARDFGQASSNAVASNVSAPVDGIAWLLRKFGVNVGTPVGGSDWMAAQGLTRDVKPGAAQVLGETAGLLSPTLAAAKAPQIARGLLTMGENAAAPATIRGLSSGERGVFDLTGLTRDQGRELLSKKAEEFAAPLRDKGFAVDITQSGSAAGPSFYANVSDPVTGRFFTSQVRFSGHSKGAFNSQFVHDMGNDPGMSERLYQLADQMRAMGKSSGLIAQEEAAAKQAKKLQDLYEIALDKQSKGIPLSRREQAAISRNSKE